MAWDYVYKLVLVGDQTLSNVLYRQLTTSANSTLDLIVQLGVQIGTREFCFPDGVMAATQVWNLNSCDKLFEEISPFYCLDATILVVAIDPSRPIPSIRENFTKLAWFLNAGVFKHLKVLSIYIPSDIVSFGRQDLRTFENAVYEELGRNQISEIQAGMIHLAIAPATASGLLAEELLFDIRDTFPLIIAV